MTFGIADEHPFAHLLRHPHGAPTCGARCACHGDIECLRVEHPHADDDVSPHVGRDQAGDLIQWVHTAEHGPTLTAAEVAQIAADTRREHTRAWLASLDLDELRAALAGH